jgi:hypothetical protein
MLAQQKERTLPVQLSQASSAGSGHGHVKPQHQHLQKVRSLLLADEGWVMVQEEEKEK